MNLNLNFNQAVAICLAVLGVLSVSSAQLTELLGATEAKTIVTVAGFTSSILSTILASITGQNSMVRGVAQMPGVERIQVNAQANTALASLAVDPAQLKIEATPKDEQAVTDTANKT